MHTSGAMAAVTRRTFLAGALAGSLAAPLAAFGQQPIRRPFRIGMMERTSPASNAANVDAFRRGMHELGYAEGEAFVLEYRSADGVDHRFPELAQDLVSRKVDLIGPATPAALAAKGATGGIPVVIIGVGDPVGCGLVASLAHPGGNVTGLSAAVTEIFPKRVQLLRELIPRATRIAVLFNMSNPALPAQWRVTESAARSLAIEPLLIDVRKADDLEPAFVTASRQRADAMIVGLDTLTQANQATIVEWPRGTGSPRSTPPPNSSADSSPTG